MYEQFFNLAYSPFSIAPDPRFLFMSERHREALAHLLYGVGSGGFVLLTGEIGAGKTTVCRCFLEQIPENCNVAYIFNPKLTVEELLKSICDEFRVGRIVEQGSPATVKAYVDALNAFLLQAHAAGKNNVLIIDEAQSLSADVLEQLRLLTNLETSERKLLQIILIGQPELREILDRPELRQLAQRIIARYHLGSLPADDTARYVQHRLAVAGAKGAMPAVMPFARASLRQIHHLTQGVPRRINLLCDRALLGAYAEGVPTVDRRIVGKAAREVFGPARPKFGRAWLAFCAAALAGATALAFIARPGGLSDVQRLPADQHPAMAQPHGTFPSLPSLDFKAAPVAAADSRPALRTLAGLWGQGLADGDPCASLEPLGLRCYRSNKGFAEIRQLDRPAMLSLYDQADRAFYAVLVNLTDTEAVLNVGGKTWSAKLASLEPHFRGEFLTLWKIPGGYRETIRRGDVGADVDSLNERLSTLSGEAPALAGQPFDAVASRRIRAFQATQDLQADGLVGPKTLMQLDRAVGDAEPQLRHDDVVATAANATVPSAALSRK